ncbi:MAG TPA: zinc-ribbon domain-containing protein, partial [Thermofilum sp.]|nr:zinc-ribbon domain-containing protein [Thermofilum sp.]
ARVIFYLNRLSTLAKLASKDLDRLSKEEIKSLVIAVERRYSNENSRHDFKVALKKFYQWLHGYEWDSKEYPSMVRWIKTTVRNCKKKLPEEILSEEEVWRMVKAAKNLRDKAFIGVLYESGCRIGEMLSLKLKNVIFDDYGAVIIVHGKTGYRRVRLVASVPHLAVWVSYHPRQDEPEAPLWVSIGTMNHGKGLDYSAARKILRDAARRAGVRKRVNPHALRHARATHLASKLTEAQMCEFFGWTQGSDMPATYVHLSGRDVDKAILSIYGKVVDEREGEEVRVKTCPRCGKENPPDAEYCMRCRMVLDERAAVEAERRERELLELITEDVLERLIEEKIKHVLKECCLNVTQ